MITAKEAVDIPKIGSIKKDQEVSKALYDAIIGVDEKLSKHFNTSKNGKASKD